MQNIKYKKRKVFQPSSIRDPKKLSSIIDENFEFLFDQT